MDLQDCIKFATENPFCSLATTDGDQPRVRTFLFWFGDENGFYFATMAPKEVCRQLKNNPRVEVCFFNNAPEWQDWKMMRVTGTIEFLDDLGLKKKLLEDRSFLKNVGSGEPEDPIFQIFRIYTGEAYFWTLADTLKEADIERITFYT
jgi:pyridoxamine 5'-phosphate oxidase